MFSGDVNFYSKITVIVPAYNVEPYIEDCIQSLFRQTLDGLEIIVVDDGSTDMTANIVSCLVPPPGKSLRLISKSNGGLSSARNLGIGFSDSDWIGLVDGDDWVHENMYADMLACAEAHNADLVICNGFSIDQETKSKKLIQDEAIWKYLISRGNQSLDPSTESDLFRVSTGAWLRLYKRQFLNNNNFSFADGILFEDILAHYQLLTKSSRVLLIDKPFYYYRVGHSGRITDRRDAKLLDSIEIMQKSILTLVEFRASPELWANFIWFQNWVLQWLCNQIDDSYTRKFAKDVLIIARKFPHNGIQFFKKKFADDEHAQKGVFLQLFGSVSSYSYFVKTGRMNRLYQLIYLCGFIQKFILFLQGRWFKD